MNQIKLANQQFHPRHQYPQQQQQQQQQPPVPISIIPYHHLNSSSIRNESLSPTELSPSSAIKSVITNGSNSANNNNLIRLHPQTQTQRVLNKNVQVTKPSSPSSTSSASSPGRHHETRNVVQKRKPSQENLNHASLKDRHHESAYQLSSSASPPANDQNEPKGKVKDKRKEQNRNAQRAFRERKEKKLNELQEKVDQLIARQEPLINENKSLKDLVLQLKSENQSLSVYKQAFTFTLANDLRRPSMPVSSLFLADQAQAPAQPQPQPTTTTNEVWPGQSFDQGQSSQSSKSSVNSSSLKSESPIVNPNALDSGASIDFLKLSRWFPNPAASSDKSHSPEPAPADGKKRTSMKNPSDINPIGYLPSLNPPTEHELQSSQSTPSLDDLARFWASGPVEPLNKPSIQAFTSSDFRPPESVGVQSNLNRVRAPSSATAQSSFGISEPNQGLASGLARELPRTGQFTPVSLYPLSESNLNKRAPAASSSNCTSSLFLDNTKVDDATRALDQQPNSFLLTNHRNSWSSGPPNSTVDNKRLRERPADLYADEKSLSDNHPLQMHYCGAIDPSQPLLPPAHSKHCQYTPLVPMSHKERHMQIKRTVEQSDQMHQFIHEGRISTQELDELCQMFEGKVTCQEKRNFWGHVVAVKPEWGAVREEFKMCVKKSIGHPAVANLDENKKE